MARFHMFHNEDDIRHYIAGEIIFKEGEISEYLYDVVEGQVTLIKEGRELATLDKGEIFGEVALIRNSDHSVTAKASSDCKLAQINKRRFLFMIEQTPNFAVSVMQVLAERLTTETAKNHF